MAYRPWSDDELIVLLAFYFRYPRSSHTDSHSDCQRLAKALKRSPGNELVEEAVNEAKEISYKRTRTRVLRVEHLLAIMLQTDRPKDRTRITQLLEEAEIDINYLTKILGRHGLRRKWQEFQRRFYGK